MKLLIMGECPWTPSSLGKIVSYLAAGLSETGFDVTVACPTFLGVLHGDITVYNPAETCRRFIDAAGGSEEGKRVCEDLPDTYYSVTWLPLVGDNEASAKHLNRIISPDIVLVYATIYGPPGSDFTDIAVKMGKPVTGYVLHEELEIGFEEAASILRLSSVATPTKWVFETHLKALRTKYGDAVERLRKKWVKAPHGLPRLYSPERCKGITKNDDRLHLLFFAKNHIRKDVLAAALAAAEALKHGINIHLDLFIVNAVSGNVWNLSWVFDRVFTETGIDLVGQGRVSVLDDIVAARGLTEFEVINSYCVGDIVLYPTLGEAFGLPVLEAALLGKPVVASEHPALKEIWGDDITYIRCFVSRTPANLLCIPIVQDIVDAIIALEDSAAREKAAEKAYNRARQYTYEAMADAITSAIERAVSDPTPLSQLVEDSTH